MPSERELCSLADEHVGKIWEGPMGPLAVAFRARVVAWAGTLVDRFQNGGGVITGGSGEQRGQMGGAHQVFTCERATSVPAHADAWVGLAVA